MNSQQSRCLFLLVPVLPPSVPEQTPSICLFCHHHIDSPCHCLSPLFELVRLSVCALFLRLFLWFCQTVSSLLFTSGPRCLRRHSLCPSVLVSHASSSASVTVHHWLRCLFGVPVLYVNVYMSGAVVEGLSIHNCVNVHWMQGQHVTGPHK